MIEEIELWQMLKEVCQISEDIQMVELGSFHEGINYAVGFRAFRRVGK